jgi:carboxylesterase type B
MLCGGTKEEIGFFLPATTNPSTPDAYLTELRGVYGDTIGTAVAAAYPFSYSLTGWEQLVIAFSDAYPTSHFEFPDPDPGIKAVTALCYNYRTLQLANEAGGAPIYGFVFADPNAPQRSPAAPTKNGPFHTSELQYLFPTPTSIQLLSDAQKELSDIMIAYWSNFIVSGDPNDTGLPFWPAYPYQSPYNMMYFAPDAVWTFDGDAASKCTSFWQPLGYCQ